MMCVAVTSRRDERDKASEIATTTLNRARSVRAA